MYKLNNYLDKHMFRQFMATKTELARFELCTGIDMAIIICVLCHKQNKIPAIACAI